MKQFDWAGYRVEVDEIATREWYAQSEEWDCECGHCRNFIAQAERLPAELLSLLAQMGIPAEKAINVCCLLSRKSGCLLYEVRYRLAGRILKREKQKYENRLLRKMCPFLAVRRMEKRKTKYPAPWELFRCVDEPEMLCGLSSDAFPEPYFEFCIQLWMPWILDEPIDG